MKIIYITNNRIPSEKAHSFQVTKMCEAFSNAGVEVELWIPRRFNKIKENLFDYYNVKKMFEIRKIFVIDAIPLSKYLGRFANLVESISFAIFAFIAVYRTKFDFIYSRDQFICWFLSFSRKKFIYEIHNFPKSISLYKKMWKRTYKVVAITQGLKNLLIKHRIDGNKILVASDAVELADFHAFTQTKEELKIELGLPKDFIVGYVGRFKTLEMEKGIAIMIEALSLLSKENKMIFVGGEDSEIKDYKTLANRFNVITQCIFVGYESHTKAIKYMEAADVLVIPFPNNSHYAFYASPLKLFEYMASGRPIIASDLPSLREVLNDKNALFFKPENAADLARAINMLRSSPMLGYHLSRQALADVREYTWDNRAKKILDFIK